MASSGSFYQLPNELLVKIFSYLDIRDLVLNIQHVDSRWKAIVQHFSIWRDYVFTFNEEMTDKEIIELLKHMPALRAVVATRTVSDEVIQTLCQSNKCITRLELHYDQRFTASHLETIVTNLPHIQDLAFPLLVRRSENAMKYSNLIQQLYKLSSLKLIGDEFIIRNCSFLREIAIKCPLLHRIDLGKHLFVIEDINSFLKEKKEIITKFAAQSRNSIEMIHHLESCKQLQSLSLSYRNETLPNIPLFDLPNLKRLAITHFGDHFPIIARNLQMSTLSNLVQLDLSFCYLASVAFKNILDNCVQLKVLILRSCVTPDKDDFQHLRKCTDLQHLDVCHTQITSSALEIIAENCRKLNHLEIVGCNGISGYSLQSLLQCKELQFLKVNLKCLQCADVNTVLLLHKLCVVCVEVNGYLDSESQQVPCLYLSRNATVFVVSEDSQDSDDSEDSVFLIDM